MSKNNFHKQARIFSVFLLLLLTACGSESAMERKEILFKVDMAVVEDSLANIVRPERIDISGFGPKDGKKGVSSLEAHIVNSPFFDYDKPRLKQLAIAFIKTLQNLLINATQFEVYYISFDKELTEGADMTRDYKEFSLLSKDLY